MLTEQNEAKVDELPASNSTKMPVKARAKLVLVLMSGAFFAGVVLISKSPPSLKLPQLNAGGGASKYYVTHVTDGDTFDVRDSLGQTDTVRMLGIDTPETKDPRKAVQCFGKAASDKTRSLLDGRYVTLVGDPTDSDRDKYHRLLRYVYLDDGTFVNAELVRQGYAFAYVVFPIQKLDEFRNLESEAHNANRGLWGSCQVDTSTKIKQTNSAN